MTWILLCLTCSEKKGKEAEKDVQKAEESLVPMEMDDPFLLDLDSSETQTNTNWDDVYLSTCVIDRSQSRTTAWRWWWVRRYDHLWWLWDLWVGFYPSTLFSMCWPCFSREFRCQGCQEAPAKELVDARVDVEEVRPARGSLHVPMSRWAVEAKLPPWLYILLKVSLLYRSALHFILDPFTIELPLYLYLLTTSRAWYQWTNATFGDDLMIRFDPLPGHYLMLHSLKASPCKVPH